MTWNPLKKSHLTSTPNPAQPLISQTEDKELVIVVEKLTHVESTIRKLTKEIKKYIEAVEGLDKADQRLTSHLINNGLTHINDDFRKIAEEYHSVTTQISTTVQEMSNLCYKTFVEPLKRLRNVFVSIESAIIKREELVNAWKYSYNRIKKLEEKKDKTASHIAKLERERRAEEAAVKELKNAHARLLAELPTFLEKALEYIKPSVQALIMIQLDYYGNSTGLFTQLMPTPNSSSSNVMIAEEEYQQSVNSQMNRIRALTIVKNH